MYKIMLRHAKEFISLFPQNLNYEKHTASTSKAKKIGSFIFVETRINTQTHPYIYYNA